MTHTRNKRNETTKSIHLLPVIMVVVITLILGVAATELWAGGYPHKPWFEKLEEAELFFELNNTDGDLGIHGKIDGGPWTKIWIKDPYHREMMKITAKGRLYRQGVTELFFESAEPTFDELAPVDFFKRFPEGIYKIYGWPQEGKFLVGKSELTHVMPAPPEPTVNEEPMAMQCDEDKDGYDVTVVKQLPVVIAWPAVTMSHPDPDGGGAGVQPPVPVTINNYEVVVEVETEDGFESVLSVILPPDAEEDEFKAEEEEFKFTIPTEFIGLGDEFKYEVLAREESFNQTAVESCFVLEDD